MADVCLQHVSKVFPGDITAVRDVSLEVSNGQLVVLVGPSGSGKTTILRMIAGLEQVSRGTIAIGGRQVQDAPPRVREVAMVFQSDALYPHMTVRGNMALALKLRKVAKDQIRHRVREAAEWLGLSELLGRYPWQLSGGQRRRVALGRAVVRRPQVFLLDEPLSNLDAALRRRMRTEIKRLHRRLAQTMVYVTHNQAEAMTMGDRVIVIRDGQVQQVAEPATLYDQPANMFVAGFLAAPPMNFMRGHVRNNDGRLWFDGGTVRFGLPDRWRTALASRAGRAVVLGIRPEDIAPGHGDTDRPESTAIVELCELLGADVHLHLACGPHRFVARVPRRGRYAIGDTLSVVFDLRNALFFDAESELAIG